MEAVVYFNANGFKIESPAGEALKNYDVPDRIAQCATDLYKFRWYILNEALALLGDMFHYQDIELELFTDSRIVEELNGDISTDDDFAKRSREFYIMYDLPRFKSVRVQKCTTSAVNRKLNDSKAI
jgi:hypothetical protein